MAGKVAHLFIADDAGMPMKETQEIRAIAAVGLEGDRYAYEKGLFSKIKKKIREVSLLELEAINQTNKFTPAETRRNVILEGFFLNDMVGQRFWIGEVLMRGTGTCKPCTWPAKYLGREENEFIEAVKGFNGLRAEILISGIIRTGDVCREWGNDHRWLQTRMGQPV